MAGAPPGFGDALSRKYANLESATQGENQLRTAQATGITSALPSENALRSAQAFATQQQGGTYAPLAESQIRTGAAGVGLTGAQTNLTGAQTNVANVQAGTLAPLAQASIAGTYGGLDADRARSGLFNAQTGQLGFDTTRPATEGERLQLRYGSNWTQNYGLRNGSDAGDGTTPGFAAGTSNVGAGPNNGVKVTQPSPLLLPHGGMDLHAIMAHALSTLHAAGGAVDVKAPGQTPYNGSWTGPTQAPTPPPSPLPPPATLGTDLRRQLGYGIKAAGGATTVSPTGQSGPAVPPVRAPGQTISNGTWGSPTPNQDLRKQMGYGVKAAGGATNIDPIPGMGGSWSGPLPNPNMPQPAPQPPVFYPTPSAPAGGRTFGKRVQAAGGASQINAKGGTSKVPGKGAPNVDSVPATLAPQEAVLNAGAAHHLGRGTISMLNALGAAKMAQAGMPPVTPPTANGVPGGPPGMPPGKPPTKLMARGMPKPAGKSDAKPVARGAPKPVAKGPPPKVAAGAGRK